MTELGRLGTEGRAEAFADLDQRPTADADRGAIMAASVIYRYRSWSCFILLRKHLMCGMTAGPVKG